MNWLKKINDIVTNKNADKPIYIAQFGEGNFLRAFVDWMVDLANNNGDMNGSIAIVLPVPFGTTKTFDEQDNMYTLVMRGNENGHAVEKTHVVTSISKCIQPYEDYEAYLKLAREENIKVVVSNTTEAGIMYDAEDKFENTPPTSFPGKVVAFLYERYKTFNGDAQKGLLFLPVELIDDNGKNLKKIVLRLIEEWNLEEDFYNWVENCNYFASTLVDRIVTGYPRDEAQQLEEKLAYEDKLIVCSELFNLWAIEIDDKWSKFFPIDKTEANIKFIDDIAPYKKQKVRILNGGHTSTVLAAFLAGHNTVGEFMEDETYVSFLKEIIYDEVVPLLDELPKEEVISFADSVFERFSNPYIKHKLLDISLNSCSKFKVRCLSSILEYHEKFNKWPKNLISSMAAFILFYKGQFEGDAYFGDRNGEKYPIRDDETVLKFFEKTWRESKDSAEVVRRVLGNIDFWDEDLNNYSGLSEIVTAELISREK